MAFPFWSKSLENPKVMFNNLIEQPMIITRDDSGNNVLIRKYPEDYILCDHISNHFTEYERINCQFGNYDTPLEAWNKIKKDKQIKGLSYLDKRELVYSNTKECNTFNVTFCLWLITSYTNNDAIILDPSSGWGDRLIAALASNALIYDGFDPNKKLQKGYKNIIKTLNKDTVASVKPIPFEEAIVKSNYYNIAITSPPYFDLEKYGTDTNQSIIKYPTYQDWLNKFYRVYILKMVSSLKSGGHLIIYIEDVVSNGTKYNMREFTIKTVEETNLLKDFTKLGLKVGKVIRYALIWEKI